MSIEVKYEIIKKLENQYFTFLKLLDGVDEKCYEVEFTKSGKSPRDLVIKNINLINCCLTKGELTEQKDNSEYSVGELKYVFSLLYVNMIDMLENMKSDSNMYGEYKEKTVFDFSDKHLIYELEKINAEFEEWRFNIVDNLDEVDK